MVLPKKTIGHASENQPIVYSSAQNNLAEKLLNWFCPKKETTGRTIAKGGKIFIQNQLQLMLGHFTLDGDDNLDKYKSYEND